MMMKFRVFLVSLIIFREVVVFVFLRGVGGRKMKGRRVM